MELRDLTYTKIGQVGLITLNRPEVLNALRRETFDDLAAVLQEAKSDKNLRCLVITGNGQAFSAGQDLTELSSLAQQEIDYYAIRENVQQMQELTKTMLDMPKPVIAAVNGYAIGAGAELAIACDIRYASEKASFEFSEVKVGLFETNGVTWLLPRLIGLGRAKELMLTGRRIDVNEAAQIGLVATISSPDKLLHDALARAEEIAKGAPVPIRFVKSTLNKSGEVGIDEALVHETDAVMTCFYTEDVKEGALAFIEKREPQFKGR